MYTAEQLVGIRARPAGQDRYRYQAARAAAYHGLQPYPYFAFKDWVSEERGPLPTCLPFPREIVRKGAQFLFGRSPRILVAGSEELQTYLHGAWTANRMPSQMVAAAEAGGVQGGVVLKFSYDETRRPALQVQVLSIVDHVRLYYNPHDAESLLMARVQYPYFDAVQNGWYFHREEWTDELYVTYEPLPAPDYGADRQNPWYNVRGPDADTSDRWVERRRVPNPYGLIPLQPVSNAEGGQAGDLWGLFHVVDRVNLTYHLMDRGNQVHSDPRQVFIDATADGDDPDRALEPGDAISVRSADDKHSAKVELLEPSGTMRPAMESYADELVTQVYEAAGSSRVRPGEVTNKGNMTSAVLKQLYAPLVLTTEAKRRTYGEGLSLFLERVLLGLSRLGVVSGVDEDDYESYDVTIDWPPMFERSDEEKLAEVQRLRLALEAGLIPRERAAVAVAQAEGHEDVDAYVGELEPAGPAQGQGDGEGDEGEGERAA